MGYLVRKITRAKWEPTEGLSLGEIPADAVTVDLRTSGNTLSFWAAENTTAEEIQKTVLAMATSAERIDKIDVTWIDEEWLESEGLSAKKFEFERSPGRTPVATLREKHVDLKCLDLSRLGGIARLIAESIEKNNFHRFTKKDVFKVVAWGLEMRLLNFEDLEPKVKEEIERRKNR